MSSGPSIGGKAPVHVRDKRRWSWLITLLKVGLSALAFGVVVFSVDLSAAWQHAANQSIPFVGLSALILTLQLLLGGLRWHAILARLGANPSLRDSCGSITSPLSSMPICGERSGATCCEHG